MELSLHPEVMNLIFRLWGTPVVDMFATVHNTHLPQFMSPVPEPRALAIDTLSQDWQGRSMYICVWTTHTSFRTAVTTGIYLKRQVVLSARMEDLMLHYQAAGFSREVSKLAAAPRRPSSNKMYDDRWLCFANWATGQGFHPLGPAAAQIAAFLYELFDTHGLSPQTIKGFRSCLASVLSHTGKAAAGQAKNISDIIMSMEL